MTVLWAARLDRRRQRVLSRLCETRLVTSHKLLRYLGLRCSPDGGLNNVDRAWAVAMVLVIVVAMFVTRDLTVWSQIGVVLAVSVVLGLLVRLALITVAARYIRRDAGAQVPDLERPSERIVDQRIRNRTFEALEALAAGPLGVRAVGVDEYFEQFFDWVDDDRSGPSWREVTTYTGEEVDALGEVHDLLVKACKKALILDSDDAFSTSEWPGQIREPAAKARRLIAERGLFSEDVEEDEPGLKSPKRS